MNNVGQVEWNYLSHRKLQNKIIELNACEFEKTCKVLNVANYVGYHTIDALDKRANYFGVMYGYTE